MHALRKYLGLLILGPLVVVSTLILILGSGLHQVPLVVSQQDQGFDMPMAGHLNVPETLVASLSTEAFAITKVATAAEAKALFDAGTVRVQLSFPENLTEDMFIKTDDPTYVFPNKISLRLAGDNPLEKIFVLAAFAKGFGPVMTQNGGLTADSLPIPLDFAPLFDGFAGSETYMLVTLLGFLASVLTGILALLAASSLRREGLTKAATAPADAVLFVVAFGTAGLVLYFSLLAVIIAVFGLSWSGELALAGLVVWMLTMATSAIAQAAALNAPKVEMARGVIAYLVLPLFLGGILFSAHLMPVWLQWLTFVFPAAYALPAATEVALGHFTPFFPWAVGILALFILLPVVGAIHGRTSLAQESST